MFCSYIITTLFFCIMFLFPTCETGYFAEMSGWINVVVYYDCEVHETDNRVVFSSENTIVTPKTRHQCQIGFQGLQNIHYQSNHIFKSHFNITLSKLECYSNLAYHFHLHHLNSQGLDWNTTKTLHETSKFTETKATRLCLRPCAYT